MRRADAGLALVTFQPSLRSYPLWPRSMSHVLSKSKQHFRVWQERFGMVEKR